MDKQTKIQSIKETKKNQKNIENLQNNLSYKKTDRQ